MSQAVFRGRYELTLDEKGRLSIPSRFRETIEKEHAGRLFLTNLPKCLVAYTPDEWAGFEAKVRQMPGMKPNVQDFLRFFYSGATECEIDRQGRILIPPTLRSVAALERQVMLLGLLNRIEIWDRKRWEEQFAESMMNFDRNSDDLSGFGL